MCRLVKFCLVYGFLKMKKNIWNSILFQKQEFSLIVFKSQYCSEIKDNASLAKHDWATSLSFFTFMHWRRKWQSTPVFLPEESHGQRSLAGYSPWNPKEVNMTERLLPSRDFRWYHVTKPFFFLYFVIWMLRKFCDSYTNVFKHMWCI